MPSGETTALLTAAGTSPRMAKPERKSQELTATGPGDRGAGKGWSSPCQPGPAGKQAPGRPGRGPQRPPLCGVPEAPAEKRL